MRNDYIELKFFIRAYTSKSYTQSNKGHLITDYICMMEIHYV